MRRLLAAAMLSVAGCSDGAPPEIMISDAWVRETVPGHASAAAYLTIRNHGGEDRLVAAMSPAAERVMLHSSSEVDGIARMRRVTDGLEIGAGSTVRLAPGGSHFMLTQLRQPLREGDTIQLTLRFERTPLREVRVPVIEASAQDPHGGHEK